MRDRAPARLTCGHGAARLVATSQSGLPIADGVPMRNSLESRHRATASGRSDGDTEMEHQASKYIGEATAKRYIGRMVASR